MTTGLMGTLIVSIIFYILIGQRVLDKLRLTDKTALLIIVAMATITILVPNITLITGIEISIGGGIIPMVIVIYLYVKDTNGKEKIRSSVASVLSAILIYYLDKYLPSEPEHILLDMNILYGTASGTIAYLLSRSRRCAFIAGVMAVMLNDLSILVSNIYSIIPVPVKLGGAGLFDSTVISGMISVIFVDILLKIREKLGIVFKEER